MGSEPVVEGQVKATKPKYCGYAIASFFIAFVGVIIGFKIESIFIIIISPILAIILGYISRFRIRRNPNLKGHDLAMGGIIFGFFCIILLTFLLPSYIKPRSWTQFDNCCSNLIKIAHACESYAGDNHGHFPEKVSILVRSGYLREAPVCPSANSSQVYEAIATHTNPDRYTVFCSGVNHLDLGAGPGFPQFSSMRGLLRRNENH
jgi:hypothetical protein